MTEGINAITTKGTDSHFPKGTGVCPPLPEKAPIQDSVSLSGEKSLGRKILELPKTAAKAVVGSAFAVASAALHTPAGTIEGMAEGLSPEQGRINTGWFTGVTLGEFALAGGASGLAIGGPVGMGIGAGIGLAVGLLNRAIEGKAGFPDRFCKKVEDAVYEAVKDNHSDSKIRLATQNLTEGAITGTMVGFRESINEGYQAGSGVVDGVCDFLTGFAQGIKDVFKNHR
jgi:hypothetical protein